jgi:spore coat polysaccharide biosynthesis protein SpsF
MDNEQQNFWKQSFGNEYINRNQSEDFHSANLALFSKIMSICNSPIESAIEFGANIGMNAKAIKALAPNCHFKGIEINKTAADLLKKYADEVENCSIEEYKVSDTYTLSFTKGVLIHLNPSSLKTAYEKIFQSSEQYILVAEYYSPNPVEIEYRGHKNRLFKRDFAGELLDEYPELLLLDYGFSYHRGSFPQDDISWFLLEKRIGTVG